MPNKETEEEKARRERQEYIDLLKMKQGLIEKSELIPEIGYKEIPELHGWAKVKNYFYHNKWFILLGAFFAAVAVFLTVQILTREKEDMHILVLGTDPKSELGWRLESLETALEKYCPDFDGNGKVHVGLVYIDLSAESDYGQYYIAQMDKYSGEMLSAQAQMIISDEFYYDFVYKNTSADINVFLNLSEEYPEEILFKDRGVRIKQTELRNQAGWQTCPENVLIYIRDELNNGSGSVKTNAKEREHAKILLQNIVNNNIVNPGAE